MDKLSFIYIHRKIKRNPIYKDVYSRALFIDLLIEAKYMDMTTKINGKDVTMRKGSLIISITEKAKEMKVSRRKITNILQLMEKEGIITFKTTNKHTVIKIVNYEKYQDVKNYYKKT